MRTVHGDIGQGVPGMGIAAGMGEAGLWWGSTMPSLATANAIAIGAANRATRAKAAKSPRVAAARPATVARTKATPKAKAGAKVGAKVRTPAPIVARAAARPRPVKPKRRPAPRNQTPTTYRMAVGAVASRDGLNLRDAAGMARAMHRAAAEFPALHKAWRAAGFPPV